MVNKRFAVQTEGGGVSDLDFAQRVVCSKSVLADKKKKKSYAIQI